MACPKWIDDPTLLPPGQRKYLRTSLRPRNRGVGGGGSGAIEPSKVLPHIGVEFPERVFGIDAALRGVPARCAFARRMAENGPGLGLRATGFEKPCGQGAPQIVPVPVPLAETCADFHSGKEPAEGALMPRLRKKKLAAGVPEPVEKHAQWREQGVRQVQGERGPRLGFGRDQTQPLAIEAPLRRMQHVSLPQAGPERELERRRERTEMRANCAYFARGPHDVGARAAVSPWKADGLDPVVPDEASIDAPGDAACKSPDRLLALSRGLRHLVAPVVH